MDFLLPDLEVNMIITTPYKTLTHITPNRKYVIHQISQDMLWIRNDADIIQPYRALYFIEADVFFALSLYITFMRVLNLTSKPWESLEK